MIRLSAVLIAATLIAVPSFAGIIAFDLPQLTFPEPAAPITPSTSGTVHTPAPSQD